MVLVMNTTEEDALLERGDAVAAAFLGPPSPRQPRGDQYCQVNHIVRNELEIARVHEVSLPPEKYYDALQADMAARHPKADRHVLAHLAEVEPWLDVCIASGFSLGASKTRGRILQTEMEVLGDRVHREGVEPLEHHTRAVTEWPAIVDESGMRRFMGNFNWVRKFAPRECAIPMAILTRQMKKGAIWPMPPDCEEAKRALQRMAKDFTNLAPIRRECGVGRQQVPGAGCRCVALRLGRKRVPTFDVQDSPQPPRPVVRPLLLAAELVAREKAGALRAARGCEAAAAPAWARARSLLYRSCARGTRRERSRSGQHHSALGCRHRKRRLCPVQS